MTTDIAQKPLPTELAAPLSFDIAAVRGEVVKVDTKLSPDDPHVKRATATVAKLIAVTPDQYDEARKAIDAAGSKTYLVASHQSDMLKGKLGTLMEKSEDGGPVASALIQLRDQVSALDPSGINFTPGWFARNRYIVPGGLVAGGTAISLIPFVGPVIGVPVVVAGGGLGVYAHFRGNPVANYFNKFETGQGAINSVIKSLESGKTMLQNDNRILAKDQQAWRKNTIDLQAQVAYLRAVDEALEEQIPSVSDESHRQFLQEEILFPLRQRIQDLLQRLAVNQQGVLVTEVLIRNNRELIRGVDRALFVTVDALSVAVAAAMALANQKLVLDAIDALNSTTNILIAGTSARLRTQGVEIQKRASSTMLADEVLKKSFADIRAAIEDVSTYRRQQLPAMAKAIIELDKEAEEAEKLTKKMERGNAIVVAPEFALDIDLPMAA